MFKQLVFYLLGLVQATKLRCADFLARVRENDRHLRLLPIGLRHSDVGILLVRHRFYADFDNMRKRVERYGEDEEARLVKAMFSRVLLPASRP